MDRASFVQILSSSSLAPSIVAQASGGNTETAAKPDATFRGGPAKFYLIDQTANKIKQIVAGSQVGLLGSTKVTVDMRPRWVNVPAKHFTNQGKPLAYLKVQADQVSGLDLIKTKPLSWAVMYSLVKNYGDDIQSQDLDQSAATELAGIPFADGLAYLRTPISATVGGKSKTSITFENILNQALGLANGAAKGFLPITAAQVATVEQVESLVIAVSDALSAEATQQYWINQNPQIVAFTTSAATSHPEAYPILSGIYMAVPDYDTNAELDPDGNSMNAKALDAIISNNTYTFQYDGSSGEVRTLNNGVPVDPDPLAALVYVTIETNVAAA